MKEENKKHIPPLFWSIIIIQHLKIEKILARKERGGDEILSLFKLKKERNNTITLSCIGNLNNHFDYLYSTVVVVVVGDSSVDNDVVVIINHNLFVDLVVEVLLIKRGFR
jgi:hypothetical protein